MIQALTTICLAEGRLPTDAEIASAATILFTKMKSLPRPEATGSAAVKASALVEDFDLETAVSRNWAEALIVHRVGDEIRTPGPVLEGLLEDRANDITAKLGADPDYIEQLEWLLTRAQEAEQAS